MWNIYSEKFLKNSVKLLRSPFPVMLLTFFTRRALRGHSDTQRQSLVTQRVLKHSKGTGRELKRHSKDIWALKGHLGAQAPKAFGNFCTGTLEALGHLKGTCKLGHSRELGTWPLEGNLGTWALGYLDT